MLFNSEVFLFLFLPLTLAAFYLLGKIGRMRLALALLVGASLIYYAWWNPAYLPLILGSMLVNYLAGRVIGRARDAGSRLTGIYLLLGVIFNLGLLGYFKYTNFLVDNLAAISGAQFELAPIVLPLAISFFTFQQIAYLVDVKQGKAQEADLLGYALFVTFFPQLIAGPIVHHSEMMPQFADRRIGVFQLRNLMIGVSIFFIGLFKKVVIADGVAPFANMLFGDALSGNDISFADAWAGSIAYSFQIYFDFSGYSDMAIGLARMFGINLPLNFNSPYKSTGIIELWNRWHMTLSRFLRDYLYFPLGGNRLGPVRRYLNLMIVMLLGGLWHGASWSYVIWGGLHGVYLMINHVWRAWRGDKRSDTLLARSVSIAITFGAWTIAIMFFRAETLGSGWAIFVSMMSIGELLEPAQLYSSFTLGRDLLVWFAVVAPIVWCFPNSQQFMRDYINREGAPVYRIEVANMLGRWLRWRPGPAFAIALAALTAITVMSLWQPSEFIYYQF